MTLRKTHRAKEPIITSVVGGGGVMSFKVTCGAAGHEHVRFIDYGLPNMRDADYVIQLGGETAAVVHVTASTISTEGFDVAHTGNNEVLHVTVHGHIVGVPVDVDAGR